jgi:hypothetical protein
MLLNPQHSQLVHQPSSAHWHSSQRAASLRSSTTLPSPIRGSPARVLHNAVFDALAPKPSLFLAVPGLFGLKGRQWDISGKKRGGTVFVGQGARVYDWIGRWVPGGVVGGIMAWRARRERSKRRRDVEWRGEGEVRRAQQEREQEDRASWDAQEGRRGSHDEERTGNGSAAVSEMGVGDSSVWESVPLPQWGSGS